MQLTSSGHNDYIIIFMGSVPVRNDFVLINLVNHDAVSVRKSFGKSCLYFCLDKPEYALAVSDCKDGVLNSLTVFLQMLGKLCAELIVGDIIADQHHVPYLYSLYLLVKFQCRIQRITQN